MGAEFCKKNALIIIARAAKSTGYTPDILYQSPQIWTIFRVSQWLLLCSCSYSALCLLWSGNEDEDSVLAGFCLLESSTTAHWNWSSSNRESYPPQRNPAARADLQLTNIHSLAQLLLKTSWSSWTILYKGYVTYVLF